MATLADRLQSKTQRSEYESDVSALMLTATASQSSKLCEYEKLNRRTSLTADTQSYTVDKSCVWHERLQLGSSEPHQRSAVQC